MEQIEETEELKNVNPEIITEIFSTVSNFFSNYGWILLFFSIGLLYIYLKFYPYIEKYLKDRKEHEYSAKYHKNSDLFNERQIQMQRARERMQEQMLEAARLHKLKMEEKEMKRRQELEEKYNNDPNKGHRLGTLKTDYNPLMGSSSGSNYRAPKRSACGGGKGCGQ